RGRGHRAAGARGLSGSRPPPRRGRGSIAHQVQEAHGMAQVFILGAGTPTPTAERFGSSYVLQLGDEYLMFDCGPATTHKLVRAGLWPTRIGHLFFTHHHFDHDVDYPCFLLTRWDQCNGREKELEVFGPNHT